MNKDFIFTSESVTEGHPDKVADQIVDAILDDIYAHDPYARVACECLIASGLIHITGEISSDYKVDAESIAKAVIADVGYNSAELGFDYNDCIVISSLDKQSADIALGVDKATDENQENVIGAGDQGIMFGYACKQTPEYMPLPIVLASKLAQKLAAVRKCGKLSFLRPDGKTQVSVKYENGKASYVDTIVVSAQHNPEVKYEELSQGIYDEVIKTVIPESLLTDKTKIYINPTGRFVIGGPKADVGLTGRKIIVDTYGGYIPHGGGSFSGKDPTKVDRSASYMIRYICKNLVAAGFADELAIQVSYAIGRALPISITVNSYGSGKISDSKIVEVIEDNFDLTPGGIIAQLDLRRPIYRQVSNYGHFGRNDLDLPWERLDKVESLHKQLEELI